MGYVEDRHTDPMILIAIGGTYPALAIDVRLIIRREEIRIVVQ